MVRKFLITGMLVGACLSPVVAAEKAAQAKPASSGEARAEVAVATMPIFGQLLTLSYPLVFKPAFEDTAGEQYINESVLKGETVEKWSQMLTVTSAKGLAANPNVTPMAYLSSIASGFKKSCPDSFAVTSFGETKVDGRDAFAAWVSCGVGGTAGGGYSESMVAMTIKSDENYYTVQWAERGKLSKKPLAFDEAKWVGRLRTLMPMKFCTFKPGEKAPYPSCTNRS